MPSNRPIFFYLIGACAVAIYSFFIYQNAYNIPKWDDFPEILLFMERWLSADSIAEKFSAFISQTNEHILLVNHLIVLAQYTLIGHLDFAWLIYIGNLFYIGSALALWFCFTDKSNRAFCFAVVMLSAVTFYPYDSTLWAMTAISNQAVIFFAFLALHAACKEKPNMLTIMLLSSLAVFSQSNGILVLFIIGAYFYNAKNWRNLKQWLVFTISIIGLYLYWFNPVSRPGEPLTSILSHLPLQNYLLTVPTFFAYLGGSVFTKMTIASYLIALMIGLAIFTVTAIQLKRNLYSKPAVLMISFLLLSILSIASYRGLFVGPEVAFVSRYKMYGASLLIVGVLLSPLVILNIQKSLRWKIGVLSISALYFAWSFPANLAKAKIIDADLFHSLQQWVEDGDFRRGRGFFVRDADSYLFAALKNKSYNPMVLIPATQIITDVTQLDLCPAANNIANATTDFSITHKNPNAPGIKVVSSLDAGVPSSVILCSEEHSYQFEIPSEKNNEDNSVYFINRDAIAPGKYEVRIKHGNKNYSLENPFINKAATR